MEPAKIKLNEGKKESSMQKDTPYKKECLYKKIKLFFDEKRFLSRPTERIYRSYRSVNLASERKRASRKRKEKIKEIK